MSQGLREMKSTLCGSLLNRRFLDHMLHNHIRQRQRHTVTIISTITSVFIRRESITSRSGNHSYLTLRTCEDRHMRKSMNGENQRLNKVPEISNSYPEKGSVIGRMLCIYVNETVCVARCLRPVKPSLLEENTVNSNSMLQEYFRIMLMHSKKKPLNHRAASMRTGHRTKTHHNADNLRV
jgi:hypothetical protein